MTSSVISLSLSMKLHRDFLRTGMVFTPVGPFFSSWSKGRRDEGSRGSMHGFVQLEGTTENSLLGVYFSATAALYFRGRGIYRMETVAGASPDLHLVAGSYHLEHNP